MRTVSIDNAKVNSIADVIKAMPEKPLLNFYSFASDGTQDPFCASMYPSLNHPEAINYFSFMGMHNYGYWVLCGDKYEKPITGVLNGKQGKGSDLLWQAAKRVFDKDPEFFRPQRLKEATWNDIATIFRDDNGLLPFRDIEARVAMSRNYGRWFDGTTPSQVIEESNASQRPLQAFREVYRQVPGYNLDPLEKKNILFAMSLANRPERFLNVEQDDPDWPPIVDYHLMRFALRTGMVRFDNPLLEQQNVERKHTTAQTERLVRKATYDAVAQLIERSGKSMGVVDLALWSSRKYCPEMGEVNCEPCSYRPACAQRKELFQPVFCTTSY